ncbi:malto-oligosyltrehalose trehalohydrolase [filamentous cyanobacterium CCP1]|nr:malto-oligosyltrehalose trehalohydrolase [filamentous cyanobacterium CCP2]PSB67043.1 malto-oligosyltrehalose trehalohydrolase [filamentous cyanobacterium CCP1]
MQLGSWYLGNGQASFTLWAPLLKQAALHIVAPEEKLIPMKQDDRGYWHVTTAATPGTRYYFQHNGADDRPDPASYSQPDGVHEASELVEQDTFQWTDESWQGVPLEEMVIYELHVGTFTPKGTFEAMIDRLPDLKELGVNTIEIMPVAQFPGDRNWGYDGVFPFAVQNSYGGVEGLKKLVDACHKEGFAVVLDVVYNHLGPEGNYLWCLGTYFTDKYKTPWGSAINYDDAYSDGVREYFVQNVLYWFRYFHIDALRLDAVHAIYDFGAKHILQEIADATAQLSQQIGRKFYLIAESDLNDPRIIRSPEKGGYGMDAQWSDDFHHILHTLLTGEAHGYYEDYGKFHQFARIYEKGYIYAWDYSKFRKRYHGADPSDCPPKQFVVCSQNHDQVGNRMLGDRFSTLISFEAQKLAAVTILLSPYVPMLFMGEEYGEPNPFLYFVSHSDPGLVESVRKGRKEEFAAFHAEGEAPDPQSEATFQQSKLQWDKRHEGKHQTLWQFYQTLLKLRQEVPALTRAGADRTSYEVSGLDEEKVLRLRRWQGNKQVLCLMNFNQQPVQLTMTLPPGTWKKSLDSADTRWGGSGSTLPDVIPTDRSSTVPQQSLSFSPQSAVVYISE